MEIDRKVTPQEELKLGKDLINEYTLIGDCEVQLSILKAYKKFFGANGNLYKFRYKPKEIKLNEEIKKAKDRIKEFSQKITDRTQKPRFLV